MTPMPPASWLDLSYDELSAELRALGQPAFRAGQVFSWLSRGRDFPEMTNLPLALRQSLVQARPTGGVRILTVRVSPKDGTRKYLLALCDGNIVEAVLMRYSYGCTLCLSTQVGCRMGCTFCASTLNGLVRNLSPGEMLGTVAAVNREQLELAGAGKKEERAITNLVLMGSGEPLDNYENVVKFLWRVNDARGLHISHRNISLSTCGLVEGIYSLAKSGLGVTLSISLHAPNDELRRTIMPIAKRYAISGLIDAARFYVKQTGRRVIFEYSLIRGVNDTEACAQELSKLLARLQCHVNLIPLNEVKERGMKGTAQKDAHRFRARLEELGLSATVRREMGADIEGACGQLRRSYLEQKGGECGDAAVCQSDPHGPGALA